MLTRRSRLPVLLAGDPEADLDVTYAALAALRRRVVPVRGLVLACAALQQVEYAAVVADVASVEEAAIVIDAAAQTHPATPVVCLLPAYIDLDQVGGIARHAFAFGRHPVTSEDLVTIVTDAITAPRPEAIRAAWASALEEGDEARSDAVA